ncbi:MAG TPA: hypothetical protein VJ602_11230 [Paludibacter sp.]|nr:hypothetical protein [Paludibacter sp.]
MISKIQLFSAISLIVLLFSCHRDDTAEQPRMEYFELNNREIAFGLQSYSLDVNQDGRKDIRFYTQLVGDPIAQEEKVQFIVSSSIGVCLPVNADENIPVLNKSDIIWVKDFGSYQWFELSAIVLTQKIVSSATGTIRWDGMWKNAAHKFVSFQVQSTGRKYNGWVELSTDTVSEKIILHRAAICKSPDLDIYAGN